MNEKYELVKLLEGTNKQGKKYYLAYLLFSTQYKTQLVTVRLDENKYNKLKQSCPKLFDVTNNVKIQYIFDKYQPVLNV